jgi:PAS domain S-box-containing protein
MRIFRGTGGTDESRSRLFWLLIALLFIAISTIVGIFLLEQINILYFQSLTTANTHLLTILFGGAIATLAALIVLLRFEGLYDKLSQENNERKQAEKALVKSKAILSRAQVIAHLGNWAWNMKTNAMTWSDEIYKIFGYRPGEFQPSYDWLLSKVVPDDRPLLTTSLASALREDRLFNIDFCVLAPDGSVRYVNMVADRIKRDKAGSPEWMYGITQDITRRKQIEKELHDAKAQAELYIDLMGHDINNMDQIAMGYLELAYDHIENEGRLEKTDSSLLEKPIDAMKSIARLIDNVKKLQRERMGEYQPRPVDVGQVLKAVISRYSIVPGRDVKISIRQAQSCTVLANDLINDLYENIIGNTIKHSRGPLQVNVGLDKVSEDGQHYCRVVIEDTGPGITDDMKRLLTTRECMTGTHYTGKGLGLCLVRMLVDDFHGRMRIEDRVPGHHEKGARFVIMLPALD